MSINLSRKLMRELRIHLCQTSKQSAGVREFIQKNYVNIKRENPDFPILIRECSGVQPRVYARYDKGVEACESLSDKSPEQIFEIIKQLSYKGQEKSLPLTDLSASDVLNTIKQLVK